MMMPEKYLLLAFFCIALAADFASGFSVASPRSVAVASSAAAAARSSASSLRAAKGGGGGGGGGGKIKKKPVRSARTDKGFGSPPLKLADVLASFKSRVPEDADSRPCPCGSGDVYADCCGPLHRGERICSSMTDVLRSRYTAFAWRMIEYVMATTHESCRDYKEDRVSWATDMNRNGMFDSFDFVDLSVGEEENDELDDKNAGFVEFKVRFRAKEGSSRGDGNDIVAGRETVISERSRFLRNPVDGSWSYASGDVRSDVAGLESATLNKSR